jgi:hypothetical protein
VPSATPSAAAFEPVESAGQAIAAVGAFDPQFLGYAPQVPGQIGEGPHVMVEKVADGWQLTFVTGSGDCFAGCIEHAFAKFLVTPAGLVTPLCRWSTASGEVVDGEAC